MNRYELTDMRKQKDGSWFVQIRTPQGEFMEYLQVLCSRPIHDKIADKLDRLNAEMGSWKARNKDGVWDVVSKKGDELRRNFYRRKNVTLFKAGSEKRDAEYRLKQEMGVTK